MGKISKKGIFFTFIAITIMAIFILVYTPQADITLQKDTNAVKARIGIINNYINDLKFTYFEIVLRATTYKALLSLVYYVNSTGAYIQSLDSAYAEVAINGTINKVPIDSITNKKIMDNNTLSNWTLRMIESAKDTYNVDTKIEILDVSISQVKPWDVEAELRLNISVQSNVARWSMENVTVKTTVSIEGFYDPLYLMNTDKKYSNAIKRSGVEFNQWNVSQMREHLRNGTYVHWQDSDSPSFLMRFSNLTADSSCCGIESLVNPNKVSPSDQTGSYVDYLFWNQTYISHCSELYNITNPSTGGGVWDEFRYFKMDIYHLTKYNITAQDAIGTC